MNQKAKILSKPNPERTARARANGVEGRVALKGVLNASGDITDLEVIEGLPDGLTEIALTAAREIKFEPALEDGRSVSQCVRIEYSFSSAQEQTFLYCDGEA